MEKGDYASAHICIIHKKIALISKDENNQVFGGADLWLFKTLIFIPAHYLLETLLIHRVFFSF